jgi:hypothetical protein
MQNDLPSLHGVIPRDDSPDLVSRRALAEDLAWEHLYRAVRTAPAAAEVAAYLEEHPAARERLLPLYLRSKETLAAKRLADEQNERMLLMIRTTVLAVASLPVRVLRGVRSALAAASVMLETPEAAVKPAVRTRASKAKAQVDALAKSPDLASAMSRFDSTERSTSLAPAAQSVDSSESRGTKAA